MYRHTDHDLGGKSTCLARLLGRAGKFGKDETGSMTILALFLMILILVVAGMAVDLMRYETTRIKLQNTLDNAVLAAADLDQELDPKAVVIDYFTKAGLSEYLDPDDVIVEQGVGFRSVQANANIEMGTIFMNWIGIETMSTPAAGGAAEGIGELEISLVLDVSGSMGDYNRLSNLKVAGKDFIDTIFNNSQPEMVSVNIVPYSTQVNVGSRLLSEYSVTNEHAYSHCVDFASSAFSSAGLSTVDTLQRTSHFDPFYPYQYGEGPFLTVCPTSNFSEVMALSGSRSGLKNKIDSLQAGGNTSIDVGTKWGAALLDPGTRGVVDSMISSGDISNDFVGRPVAYNDAMKVMVVMTDGVNTDQYYMPSAYTSGLSDIYIDPDNGRLSVPYSARKCSGRRYSRTCWTETGYYYPHNQSTGSYPTGGSDARLMSWTEVWARMTTSYHAYLRYLPTGNSNIYYDWVNATRDSWGQTTKNARLQSICDAVKGNDVLLFTIGFEVTDASANVMRDCATSPSHFYRVEGVEISEAFAAIATTINHLRLTQ